MVIAVLVGSAVAVGLVAWGMFRRWPLLDPGTPAGAVHAVEETVSRTSRSSFLQRRLDPEVATGLGLTVGVVAAVIGGGVLAALALIVRSNGPLRSVDRAAATWGATNATDLSTSVLKVVTELGATRTVVVLALGVAASQLRRPRPGTTAAFLAVVVVGQNIIANLVKSGVDRVRPNLHPLAGFSGASFPSGHTTAAFACFAAFALVLGRGRGRARQAQFLAIALGCAAAVGASRVLLGVHWLTDVLGGAALGLAWFALSAIAFGGRIMRFAIPVQVGEAISAINDGASSPVVGAHDATGDATPCGPV